MRILSSQVLLIVFAVWVLAHGIAPNLACAEEAKETQGSDQSQSGVSESKPGSEKKPRGKKIREKEAEGTRAPNRFDPDTFIKSKYEYNGQPLGVDTE